MLFSILYAGPYISYLHPHPHAQCVVFTAEGLWCHRRWERLGRSETCATSSEASPSSHLIVVTLLSPLLYFVNEQVAGDDWAVSEEVYPKDPCAEIWLPDTFLNTPPPQSLSLQRRESLFHTGLSLKMFSFKCMLLYQLLWCTSFHCSQNFSLPKRLTGGKKNLHFAVIYCKPLHFYTV